MIHPRRLVLIALLVLTSGFALHADVIQMADGREFTGTILDRSETSVTIRTVISTVPVTLRLAIGEDDRIVEKKLPDGFFTPKEERIEPPTDAPPAGIDHQYLEIPIQGRIGVETVSDGVRRALAYALRKHVKHIIFTIDSSGGQYTEGRALYEILERYKPHFEYHAVIRNAEGIAMAFPLWCDTIHIRSDGRMGAIVTGTDDRTTDEEGREISDEALVAHAAAIAAERGLPGLVLAAMVIPEETVHAWREEDGTVRIEPMLAEDAAVERTIFRNDERVRLSLTGAQAAEIGIAKIFDEPLDELGTILAEKGWTAESDFTIRVQKRAADDVAEERRKTERSVRRFHEEVDENVKKHDETVRYVLGSISQYRDYDPRRDEFETIVVQGGNYDWDGYYHYRPRDTHKFTKDAKRRWRMQTDLALRALDDARKGLKQLTRLDRDAAKLGIVRDTAAELGQYIQLQTDAGKVQLDLKTFDRLIRGEMTRLSRERNREGN